MKVITILFLLLLVSPAFGELTKDDLEAIRGIVKEEVTASEKRMREYVDLRIDALDKKIDGVEKSLNARIDGVEKSLGARIDALDKRMDNMWRLMMGLFGLVAATIAVPQIIVAYRARGPKEMQTEIDHLRERLNALENTPS